MTSILDQIKNKVNIVDVVSEYIDLHKKGKNHWGVCPFHEDTNPSMSVSQEKQMFKCFVCGKGGSVITFVSDYKKIPFAKAISELAARAGLEYKSYSKPKATYSENQEKLIAALKDANNFFMLNINTDKGEDALSYADSRGLDSNTREKYGIGFSADGLVQFLLAKGHDEATLINASLMNDAKRQSINNRLTFSLRNQFGDIVGFSSRLLKGEGPKYINSIESQIFTKSKLLYNYDLAQDSIKKTGTIFINEGFMDVIAMGRAGYDNCVAIMGTALTSEHLKHLINREVILMLDSDVAGVNAALKSISLLLKNKIDVFVVPIPGQKDPDELFKEKGKAGIDEIINKKIDSLEFVYKVLKSQYKPDSPEKIETFIAAFKKYLIFSSGLEQDFYINKIANDFGIKPSHIKIGPLLTPAVRSTNKSKEVFLNTNYTHQLIKSLVKKPFLAKTLVDHHVHLSNPVMLEITKFLVTTILNKKGTISEAGKSKLLAISESKTKIAINEKQFIDIINIINKRESKKMQETQIKKIKKSDKLDDQIKHLESLRKMEKK